ncbi:hypothetical protein JOB18_030516, partial [Solea senegalensis]
MCRHGTRKENCPHHSFHPPALSSFIILHRSSLKDMRSVPSTADGSEIYQDALCGSQLSLCVSVSVETSHVSVRREEPGGCCSQSVLLCFLPPLPAVLGMCGDSASLLWSDRRFSHLVKVKYFRWRTNTEKKTITLTDKESTAGKGQAGERRSRNEKGGARLRRRRRRLCNTFGPR